jgi:hypothetical protein
MGLIILFLLFCIGISYLSYWGSEKDRDRKGNAFAGFLIPFIILSIIVVIARGQSYVTYIEIKENLAVIEQYKETIELYADKGIREFKPESPYTKELTDLKYNNYQTQIGQMIRDMRDTIVTYNTKLTGKQVMKEGWVFSWLIYLPDGMKIIKMADYIK